MSFQLKGLTPHLPTYPWDLALLLSDPRNIKFVFALINQPVLSNSQVRANQARRLLDGSQRGWGEEFCPSSLLGTQKSLSQFEEEVLVASSEQRLEIL